MDWQALRNEFPVTRRWAFLDHAAVAPLSGPARQAMGDWADDVAENGLVHEPRWLARIAEVRTRLNPELLGLPRPPAEEATAPT